MKPEDRAILFVWITILVLVAGFAVLAARFVSWLGGQPQVLAAIVSAGALIIGGILTHYFTQRREQRNEQQRALRENYMSVLGRIDKLLRGKGGADDDFSNVHLQTWVVGSQEVIEKSKSLLAATKLPGIKDFERNTKVTELRTSLENLVAAMRKDVGLEDVKGVTLENVYLFEPGTGLFIPK